MNDLDRVKAVPNGLSLQEEERELSPQCMKKLFNSVEKANRGGFGLTVSVVGKNYVSILRFVCLVYT